MVTCKLAKIILNYKHQKINRMKIADSNKPTGKTLLTTVLV